MRYEASVLRGLAATAPPPSRTRTGYQCLIAVTRPVTLWLKWAALGITTANRPAVDRTELMDRAIAVAKRNEGRLLSGLWLEFGVYRGESLRRLAAQAPQTVFGFDSFEGLPADWGFGHRRGRFAVGDSVPLPPPNSEFVVGPFEDTLPRFLRAHSQPRVSLAHIDCDLYSSTRTVLRSLDDRLREGSVLVFDEFCGFLPDDEARAFREFLRVTGTGFRYVGVSFEGAVAVELTPSHGPP